MIGCFEPSTDFDVYSVPEEVCLSRFSLAGLGKQQWPLNVLEEDFIMIQPSLPQSPLKMPSGIIICYNSSHKLCLFWGSELNDLSSCSTLQR